MGLGALNYQGVKGGIKLNDVIEEFKYAYKGQQIKAGDFVNYINGVAGQTTGTSEPIQIASGTSSGVRVKAIALNEDKIFIARSVYYTSSSSNITCLVVTINGGDITLGTEYPLYSTYATSGGKTFVMCKLNETSVYLTFEDNDGDTQSMICSVSDTVISYGSKLESSASGKPHDCKAISSNKVLLLYSYSSSSVVRGVIHTIDGSSISAGTYITITSTQYLSTRTVKLEVLSDTKFMVIYGYGSTAYLYGAVGTISNTTLSIGTNTQINTTTNSADIYNLIKLSETSVLVAYQYLSSSKYYLYGVLCTISGTSFTVGTAKKITSQTYIGHYNLELLYIEDSKILVLTRYTSSYKAIAFVIEVSSSGTITSGTILELDSTNGYSNVNALDGCLLNNSNFFVGFSHYESSESLRGQQFSIDGVTISNEISVKSYETQVTLATEPPFDGIALSSGVGGDDTAHNQQVKIARAPVAVLKTGDIIQKTWTKVSDTEYIASNGDKLSCYYANAQTYSQLNWACDGMLDTQFYCDTIDTEVGNWLMLEFTEPIKITKMKTYFIFTRSQFVECVIQGSSDGSDWVDLYNITSTQESLTEIQLNNADYYKYYKVKSKMVQNYALAISELQTSEYEVLE